MPNFRYLAMTQSGELVNGSILAPTSAEVAHRIEYLGLVPIETVAEEGKAAVRGTAVGFFNRPRAEDVTIFTRDLALLLKAGARLDTGLELLADDSDIGRLRPIVNKIRAGVLAGESFADAIAQHPAFFPPIYVALVQVGETSGKLVYILEMLANERMRAEALRRKVTDALHYPAFILLAASCVLTFFILFVLPQFSSVLRDFNAKTDSMINVFLGISDFVRGHGLEIVVALSILILGCWAALRRPHVRARIISNLARMPGISSVFNFYRTSLFCRNLGILLGSEVTLTATLRILVDIMSVTGDSSVWLTA
ncbi:MAG: type II secretion system F family protein, partial [Pseudolabrys sp.]